MIRVRTIPVTSLRQNCRILSDDAGNAVVVDPGGDSERILGELSQSGLTCSQIWLTHSHFDHVGGVARVREKTGAQLLGHSSEDGMRRKVLEIAAMYGLGEEFEPCPETDRLLTGGDTIPFAGEEVQVFHAPGHSPGSLCYFMPVTKAVIVGDVLFAGSIGRTDLPGGDYRTLVNSIKQLFAAMPADTRVLSGHGPDTTLENERRTNPFLLQEKV